MHTAGTTSSLSARILAPSTHAQKGGITWHETDDFHNWMKTYCPSRSLIAVCLRYGPETNEGVTLEEVSGGSSIFVKTGNYFITGTNFKIPPSSEVDWRVL